MKLRIRVSGKEEEEKGGDIHTTEVRDGKRRDVRALQRTAGISTDPCTAAIGQATARRSSPRDHRRPIRIHDYPDARLDREAIQFLLPGALIGCRLLLLRHVRPPLCATQDRPAFPPYQEGQGEGRRRRPFQGCPCWRQEEQGQRQEGCVRSSDFPAWTFTHQTSGSTLCYHLMRAISSMLIIARRSRRQVW